SLIHATALPSPRPPTPGAPPFPYTTLFRSQSRKHRSEFHVTEYSTSFGTDRLINRFDREPFALAFSRQGFDWLKTLRAAVAAGRSEEHTPELQSRENLVCRLLLDENKIIAQ